MLSWRKKKNQKNFLLKKNYKKFNKNFLCKLTEFFSEEIRGEKFLQRIELKGE